MNRRDHIVTDPDILCGQPGINSTRLSVEFLLGPMAEEWTQGRILDSDPRLRPDDLRAVIASAQQS